MAQFSVGDRVIVDPDNNFSLGRALRERFGDGIYTVSDDCGPEHYMTISNSECGKYIGGMYSKRFFKRCGPPETVREMSCKVLAMMEKI